MLDDKMDELRSSFGEIGDMRLAVMAGIMVTDELVGGTAASSSRPSARRKPCERLVPTPKGARSSVKNRVVYAIGEAAGRIEKLADSLHRGSN